jgi:hypothetical protein
MFKVILFLCIKFDYNKLLSIRFLRLLAWTSYLALNSWTYLRQNCVNF